MKSLSCFDCSRVFSSRGDLVQHKVESHFLLRLFVCKLCNETSNTEDGARQHIYGIHFSNTKTYALEEINSKAGGQKDEDEEVEVIDLAVDTPEGDSTAPQPLPPLVLNPGIKEEVPEHSCDTCKNGFPSIEELEQHMIETSNNNNKRPPELPVVKGESKRPRLDSPAENEAETASEADIKTPQDHNGVISNGEPPQVKAELPAAADSAQDEDLTDTDTQLMFSCEECEQKFYFEALREQHIQVIHRGKSKYECHLDDGQCGAEYRGCAARLHRHIVQAHLRDLFAFVSGRSECPSCGLTVSRRSDLSLHLAARHPELVMRQNAASAGSDDAAPLRCGRCQRPFYFQPLWAQHEATRHRVPRSHACLVCGKAFRDEARMAVHVISYHMKDVVAAVVGAAGRQMDKGCAFCPAQYSSSTEAAKHMIHKHKRDTFHLLNGTMAQPAEQGSAVGFSSLVNIKDERLVPAHPSVEEEDGQSPKTPFSIADEEEGSYNENEIDGEIKEQKPIINQDQPEADYRCEEADCQESFYYKMFLDRHKAIHAGTPETQCHKCSSTFSKPSKSIRHMIDVHMAFLFKSLPGGKDCTLCTKSYCNTHNLKFHMIKDHSREVSQMVGGTEES